MLIAFPEARHFPRLSMIGATVALAALLIGPAAYAAEHDEHGVLRRRPGGQPGDEHRRPRRPRRTRAAPAAPGGSAAFGAHRDLVDGQQLYDYLLANRGDRDLDRRRPGLRPGRPDRARDRCSPSWRWAASAAATRPRPSSSSRRTWPSGQLRYVIVGGGGPGGFGGPGGGRGASGDVTAWVTSHGSLVTSISGVSLYDLSGAG